MSELTITDERNRIKFMHRLGIAWPKLGTTSEEDILSERELPSFALIDLLKQECELCIQLKVTHSDCGQFTTLRFYIDSSGPHYNFSEYRLLSTWYDEKLMPDVVVTLDRIYEKYHGEHKRKVELQSAAEREYNRLQNYLLTKK